MLCFHLFEISRGRKPTDGEISGSQEEWGVTGCWYGISFCDDENDLDLASHGTCTTLNIANSKLHYMCVCIVLR
jgi:hypothetical protein